MVIALTTAVDFTSSLLTRENLPPPGRGRVGAHPASTRINDSKAGFSGCLGGRAQGVMVPPWQRHEPPKRPPEGSARGVPDRCCNPWQGRAIPGGLRIHPEPLGRSKPCFTIVGPGIHISAHFLSAFPPHPFRSMAILQQLQQTWPTTRLRQTTERHTALRALRQQWKNIVTTCCLLLTSLTWRERTPPVSQNGNISVIFCSYSLYIVDVSQSQESRPR